MSKIQKFLDPNTPFNKLEELMSELLKDKFEQDLIDRYEKILETDHKYYRNPKLNIKAKKTPVHLIRNITFVVVATVALIAAFIYTSNVNNIENDAIAQNYLADNPMFYNDVFRNESNNISDLNRVSAIKSINAKDYDEALKHFELIDKPTAEDLFYISYSKLNLSMYDEAYNSFSELARSLASTDKYFHETQFYLAICLFSLEDQNRLQNLLSSWKVDSWEFKEFNKMTNSN